MRSRVAGRWACVFLIPLSSVMAQEGVFAIQGFSNQQRLWSDGQQSRAFGARAGLFLADGVLAVTDSGWGQGGSVHFFAGATLDKPGAGRRILSVLHVE